MIRQPGTGSRHVIAAVTCCLFAVLPLPALAASCIEALEPLLEDTSDDCIGIPSNPKFFEASTLLWGGTQRLVVNTGNELRMWSISDPQAPVFAAESAFNVPNQGDSDYDLLNHSFCDDCRFGVAVFKLGVTLFDLGTFWGPGFTDDLTYFTSSEPWGSMTFKVGNQQYLLANFLPNDCGGDATLYKFNGIDSSDLQQIGCVDVPDYNGRILNGFHIESPGVDYLYLGFLNGRIYIFEIQDFGNTISLNYTGNNEMRAFLARGKGMRVDKQARLAVTTMANDGMRIWDISNPANPVQRSFRAGNVDLAGIRYPFAWVGRTVDSDSNVTYNIENPSNPVVLDQDFWRPEHPWNSHTDHCEWPQSATFSEDGTTMYLARYSVVQMIGFSGCDTTILRDGFESGDSSAWTASVP